MLHAYTWEHPQSGDGVSFSLTMFKKGDGPRLDAGGQIDPEAWFEPIDDVTTMTTSPFDTDKPRRHAGGGGGLFEQE